MLVTPFTRELPHEAISTRKMLARIPQDKMDWKPHEKSMSLGQLASHVAEIPAYVTSVMTQSVLDFNPETYRPMIVENAADLVTLFDKNLEEAMRHLQGASDEHMLQEWTLSKAGTPMLVLPRIGAMRGFVMSHFIHHRGQLSVYLRLLNIPVPSIYGPSADEDVA